MGLGDGSSPVRVDPVDPVFCTPLVLLALRAVSITTWSTGPVTATSPSLSSL